MILAVEKTTALMLKASLHAHPSPKKNYSEIIGFWSQFYTK
jgi:hypothetical protein